MTIIVIIVAIAVLLAAILVFVLIGIKRLKGSAEYQAGMKRRDAFDEAEESTREEADWFGKTGLAEIYERELPKYLRRELGESVLDATSPKAGDLKYVGRFTEEKAIVHYWHVPYGSNPHVYAYIEITENGDMYTSWGNRIPPKTR